MEPLRIIETHAAGEESAGEVWGLRYELLWTALGGVAASLLIIAALVAGGHASLLRAALATGPAILTVGFAIFRQTHPPGYDTDLLDLWLHGPGFGPQPPHEELP